MVITNSKSMYQPGKVANPARAQLNRENLVSRVGFGSPVLRQHAHLDTVLRLNLVLTYETPPQLPWRFKKLIPPEFRGGVYLFRWD